MLRKIPRKYFEIFDFINRHIKKRPKSIFIYSNLGFRDNIKAIYDFFINDNRFNDYKIVCSLNNYKQVSKNPPKNVTFVSNIKGIFYFFRSKYCFYCFGKYPIKPADNQVVCNLWHGMPLKTIGNMQKGCENIKYNYFTYVLATSQFYKDIMKKSFSCSDEQVLICGQPRNDEMFVDNKDKFYKLFKECTKLNKAYNNEGDKTSFNKVIVWLPTYRDSDDNQKLPLLDNNGLNAINDKLVKDNSIVIIKPHPLASIDYTTVGEFSNIFVCDQSLLDTCGVSVYALLSMADALITDYSSVYFDYLLLDRPIGFTVEDMSKYEEDRGFVFDNPNDYMPGMKIHNQEEMITFVKDLTEANDLYKEERKKINEVVNFYVDGCNSERICKKIGLL